MAAKALVISEPIIGWQNLAAIWQNLAGDAPQYRHSSSIIKRERSLNPLVFIYRVN